LENTCEGGESIFSDSLRVGQILKQGPTKYFQPLWQKGVTYKYQKHGYVYAQSRKVLDLDANNVFWSPPFQSTDQPLASPERMQKWLTAARKFRALLEQEHWVYEYKMKPGQCVLFDNLRVLHGRRRFDTSSGSRWLKGAYIAGDVFASKTKALDANLSTLNKRLVPPPLYQQAGKLAQKHKVWDLEYKSEP
jgi:gamma-butyrobetaine dioxygenase